MGNVFSGSRKANLSPEVGGQNYFYKSEGKVLRTLEITVQFIVYTAFSHRSEGKVFLEFRGQNFFGDRRAEFFTEGGILRSGHCCQIFTKTAIIASMFLTFRWYLCRCKGTIFQLKTTSPFLNF